MAKIITPISVMAWALMVGPYRVTSEAGIGAYRLEDLDENTIPRPWNVNNLRRYYY